MGATLRGWQQRIAASIAIGTALIALPSKRIGFQDLGALLARQPSVATRWQQHLVASPFGTIHAAALSPPRPLGTAIPPPPIYALAKFDPAGIAESISKQLLGNATAPLQFAGVDRTTKQDSLLTRPRMAPATMSLVNPKHPVLGTPVLAPTAFVHFCNRYPDDCKVRQTEFDQTPAPLTEARFTELSKVNSAVNNSIKPQVKPKSVLVEDWVVAPHEGDCTDYAVTKRHILLARGWPSDSLLLAEVVITSGEHHLVLVVRTSNRDLVLDNLNSDIRPISQSNYRWVRGQRTENPRFWSTIKVEQDRLAMNSR
jgi:predicted transglutaminase-like cysteine proteinase